MSAHRLERLHALRGRFEPAAVRERLALLRALTGTRWRDAASLAAWHDELLFVCAFPDARTTARAARAALASIARAVAALPAHEREALTDSGIAGTETRHAFNFGAARWLAAHDECIAFDWPSPRAATRLDPLLRLVLTPAEEDRFDSGEVSTTGWLGEAAEAAALGIRGTPGAAYWLLSSPPAADPVAMRTLYDDIAPPLRWMLGDSRHASTHLRLAARPVLRRGFRALPPDPIAHVMTPLRGIRRAQGAEAARWHDAAVAALLARAREVFPTIYANPREILLAPLGEGVTLCLLGVAPQHRSALEANYGYVMFSNGIPIGYGGVTTFGAQANTGANVFESFRRSEAPFLFAQALRAFRTLFGITRFVVNPYQFGAGNDEALRSGAYWFYDRLGFRPAEPARAARAERERRAIATDAAHRSSPATLRALARGDLVLTLPDAEGSGPMPEHLLVEAGALATAAMARVPAGARTAWIDDRARRLLTRCTGTDRALTRAERQGARHLLPVLAPLVPGIARWPAADRAALWELVALKGAAQERRWAQAAARHRRLWQLLRRRAAAG